LIAVVHLVWGPLGATPLRRFVESYRAFDAGAEHELIVLLNGVDRAARGSLLQELEGVEHRLLETEEPAQDLAAYAWAGRRLEHERLCFLNSYSTIRAPGWLAKLDRALEQPRAGAVGTSGSWGSIRSYLRFSLGLGGPYARVFEDRQATIDTLEAIAEERQKAAPKRRRIPVLTYAAAVLDQAHGFVPFPARHLRTTGFMLSRELFAGLRVPDVERKNDAYRLESGRRSISAQVARQGLELLVVDREGRSFAASDWAASRTFWQGDQENLLIADNQTASYEQGSATVREVLARYAWGELADPVPSDASSQSQSQSSSPKAGGALPSQQPRGGAPEPTVHES
jgi:hypothetical protein